MGRPSQSQPNQVVKDILPKSKGLSAQASLEWDRIVKEVAEAGVKLSAFHRAPLTLAATIAADIKSGWEQIKKDGEYIMSKAGLQAHPAAKRIDSLRRDYAKILAVLGLRVAVVEGGSTKESLEDALNG